MERLYIGSLCRFSGKTVLTLGLALNLKRMGYRVGYVKPIGKTPERIEGSAVDADAAFMAGTIGVGEPLTTISPLVLTLDTLNRTLSGKMKSVGPTILDAIGSVKNKDIVLISGTMDVFEGAALGMSGAHIVKECKAGALIVEPWNNQETLDDIFAAREIFGPSLVGVVINKVRPDAADFVESKVSPYLAKNGIALMGVLPEDPVLGAVSVRELVDQLNGQVLCAEDRLDELVEHFSIGAMDVHNALRYFKITPNKAVITGADRADIQIAALETSTKCIILTGGLMPNDVIIGKAKLQGVPVISVREDTFHTVDAMERIMGKFKLREKSKIARATELVKKNVNIKGLLKALGVKKKG